MQLERKWWQLIRQSIIKYVVQNTGKKKGEKKKQHLYRRLNGQFLAGTNESEDASQHTRVYIHMYI